jgi:hypothetical protein
MAILFLTVEHVSGPKTIAYAEDQLVILCVVRDSELLVNSFIKHYLSIGAKHIFFLDNNSSDDTVSLAQQYEKVSIFRTGLPFKRYKMAMRHFLIRRFAKRNRWTMCVDIDELFDYPFSSAIDLSSLLRYLNEKSFTAVAAHMLDMFSDRPLGSIVSKADDTLSNAHNFYDVSNILQMKYFYPGNELPGAVDLTVYFGGIRKTLFSPDETTAYLLTKHPLFLYNRRVKPLFLNEHGIRGARVADLTCVLYHYKFLSDFYERTVRAVREENYFNRSEYYRKRLDALEKSPELTPFLETAQELKSVDDLLENGFLFVSEDYVDWVASECGDRSFKERIVDL